MKSRHTQVGVAQGKSSWRVSAQAPHLLLVMVQESYTVLYHKEQPMADSNFRPVTIMHNM